mmetsp:Transcript_5175/g.18563  ORF Transcript_5175/g.18563 Transcript_5175/m.18563 type:complete len:205 (-) Transcript_5175:308-922(-)
MTLARSLAHCLDSSSPLSAAAFTARMNADRTPHRSNSATAAIVVPPGDVTPSFNAPGCFPVSMTIFAAPITVLAARSCATPRGSPAKTPPSAMASMTWKTYAGPLPLTPVTAFRRLSFTWWIFPTASNSVLTVSACVWSQYLPADIAAATHFTRQGVFGMTRIIGTPSPAAASMVAIVTPAAMETTSVSLDNAGRISSRTAATP